MNRNADSYHADLDLVDWETLNHWNSLQSVKRITLTPIDFLSNSNDTSALHGNKTPQLQGVTLSHTMSNSSEDTTRLNVNEITTETENLRAEMIALRSFVEDQIYMVKKDQMVKMTSFWSKTYLIKYNF